MSKSRPQITPLEDGPLRVQGLKQLQTPDGPTDCAPSIALCRCGRSAKKPYCDGTHVSIGFKSERTGGGNPDKRDEYAGKQVTIHDNRALCAHAGFCTDDLSSVFRMKEEPWIDPDGAAVDDVLQAIKRCPSGALSYTIEGVEHRDDDERAPAIFVAPNGPYALMGGCELLDTEWGAGASKEHFDLCRCGGSRNKPFCDGAHWTVWKDGEDAPPPAT